LQPGFGPPAIVQRTVGGVRDAATIQLATPDTNGGDAGPSARLDVIVFNREARAAAWSDLMAREMDVRDPISGEPQVRVSGSPDDGLWVSAPPGGGVATVSGHRGAVGYVLQMSVPGSTANSAEEKIDLTARADAEVRQTAADWTGWLDRELGSPG
jgi:hypothetical protein